ncbi:MAG: glycosyltransferase [Planctomycetaceae bacterium]|nr:glycosyltransferase [Planctomycetaceae bacterium]
MEWGNDEPDATIVIPQHGRAELTIGVVQAVRAQEPVRWPIVVVDDGSGKDAADAVARSCGDARLLRQSHRGVTAAWNHALRYVTTPLAVLLNNDVTITGTWVDALLRPLREGQAQLSGVELRRERSVPARVLGALGRCEFLAGWCWAFRMPDYRAVDGFDESLRLYFSDTDLQARLLAAAGTEAAVVAGLPLRHLGHRSTQQLADRRAQWQSDRALFIEKWSTNR